MSPIQMNTIDETMQRATAAGALLTIRTEQTYIEDSGIAFLVRWVSTLTEKIAVKDAVARRRVPEFNPFLPPEPQLTLGFVGSAHLAVLNKYPVIARHLLIITHSFEEQTAPLNETDFAALGRIMSDLGGLGFYNGGEEAGASQRHKHLQWIPDSPQSDCLHGLTAALPRDLAPLQSVTHPALHWRHCFVRLPSYRATGAAATGNALARAFLLACEKCALAVDVPAMAPYNMLVNDHWMLVIPRSRERYDDISINALGFAGSMFVPRPEQIDVIRRVGPLNLLAAVACQ